jgi:predicted TIM-barrel fold metal-dependent hydrolase
MVTRRKPGAQLVMLETESAGVQEFSRRDRAAWIDPESLDDAIRAEVASIRVVDTHEHMETESARLKSKPSLKPFVYIYALSDMVSAGLPLKEAELFNRNDLTGERHWKIIRDFWPLIRNTASACAVRLSLKELYGIDDLRDSTIAPLMEAMAARNSAGFYRWALRDLAGIECSLVNLSEPPPGELCRQSSDPELMLYDISTSPLLDNNLVLAPYEKASGISCGNLADWKRIIDRQFELWAPTAVAIKNQVAYWRSLEFDNVREEDAAPLFEKWLVRHEEIPAAGKKAVQDFTFHHCIRRAIDYNLPIKIHTGYHAWNNYSDPSWFQPKDLARLFRRYPRARFDLFHIGYPEQMDVVALAKHYANVSVDMCWAWLLDSGASLDFLRHCLAALPSNKVFGFGGDYGYPDCVYGHGKLARDGVALVLTEAVRECRMTRNDAMEIARRWLRDNAMEMFRIESKRVASRAALSEGES